MKVMNTLIITIYINFIFVMISDKYIRSNNIVKTIIILVIERNKLVEAVNAIHSELYEEFESFN